MKKTVSILIVNYNGAHLLKECLSSVYRSDYPRDKIEIVLVDNNSQDDSVGVIKTHFPQVILIESDKNLGFAKGNNVAYDNSSGEYIVLLNTDTTVDPQWLNELIHSAEQDKKIGVVSPKLFFSTPYLPISISTKTIPKSFIYRETADFSPIGILFESIKKKKSVLQRPFFLKSGFYEKALGHFDTRWTNGHATILAPFELDLEEYAIALHGLPYPSNESVDVDIKVGETCVKSITIPPQEVSQLHLNVRKEEVEHSLLWLVQNAGNCIFKNGLSRDRGAVISKQQHETVEFYDFDNKYYNAPSSLIAACGACCLIKREVIEKVGLFTEEFFMYYEDVDFSLRVWRMGWNIMYEPKAIIYHRHRSTTNDSQSQIFFDSLVKKNYLIFLLLHFPLVNFAITFLKSIILAVAYKIITQLFNVINYYGKFHKAFNQRQHVYALVVKQTYEQFPTIFKKRNWILNQQKRSGYELLKHLY